ncbi:hypothetical protein D3C81_1667520 [compost metagenome]
MRRESGFHNRFTDARRINVQPGDQILRDTVPALLQAGITGNAPVIAWQARQRPRAQRLAAFFSRKPAFGVRFIRDPTGNIVTTKRINGGAQSGSVHRLAFLQQTAQRALMHIGVTFFISPAAYQRRNAKAAVPYRTGQRDVEQT